MWLLWIFNYVSMKLVPTNFSTQLLLLFLFNKTDDLYLGKCFPHIMSRPSNCERIENIIIDSILFYCHIKGTVCW